MKKLLLSILCLFCIAGYAVADEAKFDFTSPSGLTPSITDDLFSDAGNGALAFEIKETTFTANGVTLNTTDGSTATRIWKAAKGTYDLRVYKTATMTIAAPSGGVITAIAFDGGTVNSFSANSGTVDGKNWSGSASSVVFTWADNAKTQKINTITVTFSTDGSVTPDQGEGGDEGEDEENTEVTVSTIAEVIAAGTGNAATKGTVVATYSRGFLMSDGTGSILVYQGSDKGILAGDAVTVSGTTSVYGGLLQFGTEAVVEKTGTATVEHPEATVMNGADMDAYIAAPEIKYVEYTGTLTINNNYYNIAVEGAATAIASIQYPKTGFVTAASGDVVKVTGYTIGTTGSKYVNTMAVKVETVATGEPEEPETPIETKEYTVTEALAAYVDGQQIPAIVTGYIVGAVNGTPESGSQFGAEATVATNILISDNAATNDYTECLIVQLPKGDIRSTLNLVDNPGNYKKQIKITGSIEIYFKVAGLKSPTAYEFTGATGIGEVEGEDNETKVIFDLTGRRVENITNAGIYIVNGKKVLVK